LRLCLCVAALGGCANVHNLPQNLPLIGAVQATPLGGEVPASTDDIMVSLAFSGGGTRGVLVRRAEGARPDPASAAIQFRCSIAWISYPGFPAAR